MEQKTFAPASLRTTPATAQFEQKSFCFAAGQAFSSEKEGLIPNRVGFDSRSATATLRESRGCQHSLA
jgi:hypothetical protein